MKEAQPDPVKRGKRVNTYKQRKHLHVAVRPEAHLAFRIKALELGASVQEACEAFAEEVAAGVPSAINVIERYVKRRVQARLKEAGLKAMKGIKSTINERNAVNEDMLYRLIESEDDGSDGKGEGHEAA